MKQAYKPGSVVDDHLSGPPVTGRLKPYEGKRRAALTFPKLLRMGFTRLPRYRGTLCALTAHFHTYSPWFYDGCLFSVALSLCSRTPAVSRHPALWSPDFPHALARDRPAYFIDFDCTILFPENQVFYFAFIDNIVYSPSSTFFTSASE